MLQELPELTFAFCTIREFNPNCHVTVMDYESSRGNEETSLYGRCAVRCVISRNETVQFVMDEANVCKCGRTLKRPTRQHQL